MNDPEVSLYERLKNVLVESRQSQWFSLISRIPSWHFVFFIVLLLGGIFFAYHAYTSSGAISTQRDDITSRDDLQVSTYDDHESIYVDLTGSVINPRTYKLPKGTRLFALIEKAGGLSPEADRSFVQRNYNFAVILSDQQKVHIPSVFEVRDGYFTEKQRHVVLEDVAPEVNSVSQRFDRSDSTLVSINTGSMSSLESLPGVGQVTAERIIAGRPYSSIQDLLDKGIVKQSVFDDLSDMIEL